MAGDALRWGWHRLDNKWARRLVHAAGVERGDLVIDIGAGDGGITVELLRRGAHVIAVELHPGRAADLKARFAEQRVIVVRADAADLRLPRRPFKVVANLPFSVTTSTLRRLTSPGSRLQRATLVVPSWAAGRWAAGRGAGGGGVAARFGFESGGVVPAHAFSPPPPRDARVLVVQSRRR